MGKRERYMRCSILSMREGDKTIAKQYLDAAISHRKNAQTAYVFRLQLFVGVVRENDLRGNAFGVT